MATPDLEQLERDLDSVDGLGFERAAQKLYALGYRMPDCPDRWQVDRLNGSLVGATFATGYNSVAEVLIQVAGWQHIKSHKKER